MCGCPKGDEPRRLRSSAERQKQYIVLLKEMVREEGKWELTQEDFEEGDKGIDAHLAKYAEEDYVSAIPFEERKRLQQIGIDRWNYLHAPLHSFAAFCVNPRLHFLDHFADDEVQRDFRSCALKFAGGDKDLTTLMETEFLLHSEKEGAWSDPSIWVQARQLVENGQPHIFWKRHGDKARSLREPGVKAITGVGTAGGSERNWSAHDL
ncbi:hypothetical protein CYMTET_16137 [Cymbomonas tetramitiformis]|uniref:Uncharacterized protein n=1 Tax=Cymbomonas tetramitiformis TaxID=36881 RepID=A0AAE0L8K7_9CHLO|nr:hypothetical protein CYMTET_16137 [Cymbomonas tetramitiformis]